MNRETVGTLLAFGIVGLAALAPTLLGGPSPRRTSLAHGST